MLRKIWKFLADHFLEDLLVHLGPDELLAVVVLGHHHLHDVDQTPEGVLLVQEEKGNGGESVEALAVLNLGVVKTVSKENSP